MLQKEAEMSLLERLIGPKHHTVRTVFGIFIIVSYLAFLVSGTQPRDGIVLAGITNALIILYKAKKGAGEEDTAGSAQS